MECIDIAKNGKFASVYYSMKTQVRLFCDKIKEHPVFGKSDINIIGYSQGNMIARHII